MDICDPRRATMPYIDDEFDEYYVALFYRFMGANVEMPDGPVSLQDTDAAMIDSGSDCSTQSAVSIISLANHANLPGDGPTKAGKFKEICAENSHCVDTRKVDGDGSRKDPTVEQLRERVLAAVTELRNMQEYHQGDGMKHQKAISDIYWEYSKGRSVIGDYLAYLGYAELTIAMLKQMNVLGIFKNDDIWFPTYYTYKTCWNYSDASQKLATCLAESGIIKLMTLNLSHKPYLDNMHSKNVYYILKASLSTLHNIARCPGVMHHFKDIKTAEVVLPLISSSDDFVQSMAMLTMAYIVQDADTPARIDERNIIRNIVNLLHEALENKRKGRLRGLTPAELTQGLARLAVSDSNKGKIIEEGALPEFVSMLQCTDQKEQAVCAECIWTLCFDKSVKQTILDFPELLVAMENLKDSERHLVRKHVRGALWLMKGENDQRGIGIHSQSSHKVKNHIFISFSSSEKEIVTKLSANLTAEGYKLWVDWDQKGGSSLQTMARTMESSAAVLICMSERYMQSPSCRSEAELALLMRKECVTLLLQSKYRPDGWLGVLLGTKLFFDFSGKSANEKSLQDLLKELKVRGVTANSPVQNPNPSLGEITNSSSDSHAATTSTNASVPGSVSSMLHNSNTVNTPTSNNINSAAALMSMSNEYVENWLVSKGLQRLTSAFSQIDGQLIWQLKRLRETTPEYFYGILERQFGMTFLDILRFNAALDTLH